MKKENEFVDEESIKPLKRKTIESFVTPNDLGIKERTIIPFDNDWVNKTYYAVDIAFSRSNPIHGGIYYSGFVNSGSYSFAVTSDGVHDLSEVYYMKGIRKLNVEG